MKLEGKSVLLTGATGGIGHAIARRLADAGANMILTGRRTDVLEPLAEELGAESVSVDLTNREQTATLAAEYSGVDILIANAALPAAGELLSFSVDELDRAIEVDLFAPMLLSRVIGERMALRGSGHIVLISSLSGKVGMASTAVYSAVKFGLRGFGQGLRGDLRKRGVGVSVVFPGPISDAGMFYDGGGSVPRAISNTSTDDVAKGVLKAIRRNRMEVDVASVPLRVGTAFQRLMPQTSSRIAPLLGTERIAAEVAANSLAKR